METADSMAVQDIREVENLREELRVLGEDGFRRKYPHPFLVVRRNPLSDALQSDLATIQTLNAKLDDSPLMEKPMLAVPLVKSSRNMYGARITAGRARNNDLVIRSQKVSKIHSVFDRDLDGVGWRVMDMGSSNGTRLNGTKLEKNEPQVIGSGDVVAFWRYEFEFMILDAFIAFLHS